MDKKCTLWTKRAFLWKKKYQPSTSVVCYATDGLLLLLARLKNCALASVHQILCLREVCGENLIRNFEVLAAILRNSSPSLKPRGSGQTGPYLLARLGYCWAPVPR